MWSNESATGSKIRDSVKFEDISKELLKIQRFRIEKGKGLAYLLLSLMILVTLIAYSEVNSLLLLIAFNTANGVVIWYAVWRTGFRGVRIEDYLMLSEDGRLEYRTHGLPLFLAIGILLNTTWLVYILLSAFNYTVYAFFVPFIFVFELLYPLFKYMRKQDELLIGTKAADWAFFLSFAAAALSALIPGIGAIGFALAIPVWIGSGLKSLYDATAMAVGPLPSSKEVPGNTKEVARKLSSMGPLAFSARVAILLVLEKEGRATFTEILETTGMPKSSLKSSLTALEKAGMVTSRVSLSSTDRPRTVIEPTEKGRKAVSEYASVFTGFTRDTAEQNTDSTA